jgi:hypothetical protein
MTETSSRVRSSIVTGVTAGLVGGVLIEAYSFAAIWVMAGGVDVVREFQYTAAGLIGATALGDPLYAWLGVAVHFAISAVWGIGYVYVAARTPQLDGVPLISGFIYGFAVYLLMLILQFPSSVQHVPEFSTQGNAMIAYTFFFGIPIALIARARRAT